MSLNRSIKLILFYDFKLYYFLNENMKYFVNIVLHKIEYKWSEINAQFGLKMMLILT